MTGIMKTIYKGHLPTSLGLLTVNLSPSGGLQVKYQAPGAKTSKDVGTLQGAVDEDAPDGDPVDRLNYCSFLNGVVAERIKAATKKKTAPIPVSPEPSREVATIPITVENVGDLPENLRPETRRRIFDRLGIEDPMTTNQEEANE